MPTFRAVIERTTSSRETVEITASSLREASRRLADFASDRTQRRGITVVRAHDDDPRATEDDRVVQISER